MKKNNVFLAVGLLMIAFTLMAKQFIAGYPHFLQGIGLGLGLILEIIGCYLNRYDMPEWMKKKNLWIKKHLLHRV